MFYLSRNWVCGCFDFGLRTSDGGRLRNRVTSCCWATRRRIRAATVRERSLVARSTVLHVTGDRSLTVAARIRRCRATSAACRRAIREDGKLSRSTGGRGEGGAGSLDIYSVSRLSLTAAWSAPMPVLGPNSTALEKWYTPCENTYLVIVGGDIAEGTVGAAPTISTELSDAATSETGPFLTPDCLTTYFASPRGAPSSRPLSRFPSCPCRSRSRTRASRRPASGE